MSVSQFQTMRREQTRVYLANVPPSNRVMKREPGDLRGIPCLAPGVGGAVKGTVPHLIEFV